MARRRKRGKRGGSPAQPAVSRADVPAASGSIPSGSIPSGSVPSGSQDPSAARAPSPAERDVSADPLAWRKRMRVVLEDVRAWARLHYAEALDAYLCERFGTPDAPEFARDVATATDDYVGTPGSAGDEASILSVYCTQTTHGAAAGPDESATRPTLPTRDELSQVSRWSRERRRGVFILQRASRDRLSLWDPLEGAPLTLHLLQKLSGTEADGLVRGTVVTAAYQPWMARLVAVAVEFFADSEAVQLFREQTVGASRTWHEAPAAAPEKTRSALSKT